MAKTDPSVKEYLSANLPKLIEKRQAGWLNAVRLAGDLRIVSAVDELVVELGQNTTGGPITFWEEFHLDDDPPGKALAEIGDPAIPAAARALESDRKEVRWRAALVLMNMNSPSAREILRHHLKNEPDPHLRAVIQHEVD
jgi:HEAT repeat protein